MACSRRELCGDLYSVNYTKAFVVTIPKNFPKERKIIKMKPDYKKLFYRKTGQQQIILEIMEEKARTIEALTKSMDDISKAFSVCVARMKEIQKEDTDMFTLFEDET